MADINRQEIEVDVVADATQATRSSKLVADELARVVHQVGQLETKLRSILTGRLPAEMQKLASYVQAIQTVNGLPPNLGHVNRVARTLAAGGPATQLNNAAVQGVIANLRNDPAVHALRLERERNKVLEARERIFRRIREAAGPADLTMTYVTKAYRDALAALGEAPPDDAAGRRRWMDKTLAEAKLFEKRMGDERIKVLEASMAQYERIMRRSYNRLFKLDPAERDVQAQAMITRLGDYAAKRGDAFDASALQRMYQDEAARRAATMVTLPPPPPKPEPMSREERARQSIQTIHDRFAVDGGAGMFGVQATILRNYAAMGAVIGTVTFAGRSAVEFQAAMKDVQAIAEATEIEMRDLSKTIFEVGNNTKLSTAEIAEGTKILAQAGYSVQQIGEMIKPISDLAVGAGTSLAEAANITTSVLSIFDLSISRTSEITNTLVAGLNKSKLSMDQLTLGIQYAGNIAAAGNVQFEELVAALGAMSNAGIKSGSTLGTGLRALIQELQNPSKKFLEILGKLRDETGDVLDAADVDIESLGLLKVMENLTTAGFDSAEALNSFELRAAAAFTALQNNLPVMQRMYEEIQGTTAATKAAETQMKSFSAQWQRLLNAMTEFTTVAGGPLLNTFTQLVHLLGSLLQAGTDLASVMQFLFTIMGSIATVALVKWIAGLVAGFGLGTGALAAFNAQAVITALRAGQVGVAMGALTTGVRAMTVAFAANPFGLAVIGLTAVVTALQLAIGHQRSFNDELEKAKAAAAQAKAQADEYGARVRELDKFVENLAMRHSDMNNEMRNAAQAADEASRKFSEWGLVIDQQIGRMSTLIASLVRARREMANLQLQKKLEERDEIVKQVDKTGGEMSRRERQVRAAANALFMSNQDRLFTAKEQAAIRALQGGGLSHDQALTHEATLRQAEDRLRRQGGWQAHGALERLRTLQARLGDFSRVAAENVSARGQLGSIDHEVAGLQIQRSPAGGNINMAVQGMFMNWRSRQLEIDQMPVGEARLRAQRELDQQMATELPGLERYIRDQVATVSRDPRVMQGLREAAARSGRSVDEEVYSYVLQNTPNLSRLRVMAGQMDPNADPKLLQERAKRLEQEARTPGLPADEVRRLRGQARDLRRQVELTKAMKGEDYDANILAQTLDENAAAHDAATENQIARAAANAERPNRGDQRRWAARARALEKQIELTRRNAGPGAAEIEAALPELERMVDEWRQAKRAEIMASGGDAGDIASQLEDFEVTADEFRKKVLDGALTAAKELLAKHAREAADKAAAQAEMDVREGRRTMEEGLEAVNQAFTLAQERATDAAVAALAAEGVTSPTSAEIVEKRKEIMRESVSAMLEASNRVLDAELARVKERLAREELVDMQRSARIGALSNFYGQRNLSDVRRYLGQLQLQGLAENRARRGVEDAEAELRRAQSGLAVAREAYGLDDSPANLEAMTKAAAEVRDMERALAAAEKHLFEITGKIPAFASFAEAARAAWQAYADQAQLAKPIFEQLANGLTSVFETTRGSFKSLISDVVTGSKTMSDAFRDFTLSVLQSMVDMVAEMLANKAIMWVMNFVLKAFGGTTPADYLGAQTGIDFAPFKLGGEVKPKRFALGGGIPGRDSVPALLEPGEVVMRKSAVDFLGLDTLLQLNAMGNRRLSAMPTVQQAMQREPDQVNVWVVAPEQRPQIGKKDVVAIIGEDILTGGKVKQLIKAVQVGAA